MTKTATVGVPTNKYLASGRYARSLTATRRAQAEGLGATYILDTRYELDARRLPAEVRAEMQALGLRAVKIGSTTYRSSTWAMVPR